MSVVIRLSRQGAKKNPNYAIVATHSETARDGQYIERLGQYWPKATGDQKKVDVDMDAVNAWVARGARMSQTVGQLLKTLAK